MWFQWTGKLSRISKYLISGSRCPSWSSNIQNTSANHNITAFSINWHKLQKGWSTLILNLHTSKCALLTRSILPTYSWTLPVTVSWSHSSCSPSPLISCCLAAPSNSECRHTCHLIVQSSLNSSTIHHILYAGDSKRSLCYICCYNT